MNIYRKFRRSITEEGLIVSSSGFLVRRMLSKVDFSRPLRILEIGSGKGVFTREIIRRMHQASELHVTDIKRDYNHCIEKLMAENPDRNIRLFNHCVTELMQDAEYYDVIISSLPLKNFESRNDSNAFLHQVIGCLRNGLKAEGVYLQYQYFMSNRRDIERIFGKSMDEISFVMLNILPAFVYTITKL